MTSPLPATPRPRFVVSSGAGDPSSIDAYTNARSTIHSAQRDVRDLLRGTS